MAFVFRLEVDDTYIYDEMYEAFAENIEYDYGIKLDDNGLAALTKHVTDTMCEDVYKGRTFFEQWFYDMMPKTHDLMWDCLRDALNTCMGKIIWESRTKIIEDKFEEGKRLGYEG